MSAEIATLLREMLVELRGLRGDLRRQSNPPTIEGANNLICEIHAAISDKVFTTADLIGFAAVRPSLRVALEAVAPLDTRRLGKVLQRFDGHDCEGLHLIRVGESGTGAEWCVKRKAT